jgi:cytosine/adenosine deaminase-related metal-dependent hydrolase
MTPPLWSLTARWVFPVSGPPLQGGLVVIQGERIAAVEPAGTRQADVDFGNAAILPGFSNVHTHLDLTGLYGRCPPGPEFTAWLRGVIAHRRARTPEQTETDIRAGLSLSLRAGVTLLGDISVAGASWPILANAPLRSVVFYELLGLTESRAAQAWSAASDWLREHAATETCRPGLSPHAPYSVRASLFEKVAECHPDLPVASHLAETSAELQLLHDHEGPFVDFLRDMSAWDPDGLIAGIEPLLHCYRQREPLWIHGNYLDPALPELHRGTVVYCPRTHAAFGHPPHLWLALDRRGIRLALGTDSLASSPDLSILEEIRFLHRLYPDVAGSWLLHLATCAGARALGWEHETGALAPDKSADLVVLPLPDRDEADPHSLILESPYAVQKVLVRGMWV